MNDIIILIGNTLAALMHSLYYCLFMIYTKDIKEKRMLFWLLAIIDYILVQNMLNFQLGINADLVYAIVFYVNLKLLYNKQSRITDLVTFIISDTLLGIISVAVYFIFKMNIISLLIELLIPILFVLILSKRLNLIEKFYNKFWNRKKQKAKIKSITVRGISLCITVFEFLALHFWMLYLLCK